MEQHDWIKQFPAAVTVCDCKGVILDMNDRAAQTFEKEGGRVLIGKNLLDCHPEAKWRACSTHARRMFTRSKRMDSRN